MLIKMDFQLSKKIINNLDDSFLKKEYLNDKRRNKYTGHCYVASEVYYHLSNEKLEVYHIRHEATTHWFLKDSKGCIIDLTYKQFKTEVPYELGRRGFFLTKSPSKRSKRLINKINACQDSRENRLNTIQEGLGQFQRHAQNFTIISIDKKQTYEWLLNKHYAKRIPNIMYSFGLYEGKELIGVCTYGMPPLTNVNFICDNISMNDILELNRLCIDDNKEKNLLSYFVAKTLRLIKKNRIILSYADSNMNHNGYIYQSTNFLYTGLGSIGSKEYVFNNRSIHSRHMNKGWFIKNNFVYNEKKSFNENFKDIGGEILSLEPKHRYLTVIGDRKFKKHILKKLKIKILDYPKGKNIRYDSSYKTINQIDMFV